MKSKSLWKRGLTGVLIVFAVIAIYFLTVIVIAFITKYRPDSVETLNIVAGKTSENLESNKTYSIISFNTGYAGLDSSEDFFMDGGKHSGAQSLLQVQQNVAGIERFLNANETDFTFLQEVDESGKRSFNVNQKAKYEERGLWSSFGYNYKLKYLPIPLFDPMGGAESGIMTLSKAEPKSAERYQMDGKPNPIVALFELDRCFTVSRFDVSGGKELVLINAHFSVFDKGGYIREQQLSQMKQFLTEEYEKGNYVILGGDFNHELPGTSFTKYSNTEIVAYPDWAMEMPADFAPEGFSFQLDIEHPTCRSNNIPLDGDKNAYVVLDGFLVSDNIAVSMTKTHSEEAFRYSDHNPVELHFELKEEKQEDE